MINKNLTDIAETLNQLACKECTKGWISEHDNSTDPIEDILDCFENGLITDKLKNRLIKETNEIKNEI
tara:strand:- start:305 stop:508 length:204 start_codon:yes stop_codon:yes gene_type:complete